MPPKHVPANILLKSFSCPHCGALADQSWLDIYAVRREDMPPIITAKRVEELEKDPTFAPDLEKAERKKLLSDWRRLATGEIFLETLTEWKNHKLEVCNLSASQCHSCQKIALWKYDTLLFPREKYEVEANPDLNDDIQHDFDEAREVLDISPRSAAALLRLCIQKLGVQLGYPGKNINNDIGEMVKKGLDPRIQKALDIVRVVGNEAVHPGAMDLRDDRETATKLFGLVNRIAYDMITHPKEIDALYNNLPAPQLDGIVKRDTPKKA
jgi:hypothetical protein